MPWVSQVDVCSCGTDGLLNQTNFLTPIRTEVIDILRAYHDEFPNGEHYTLRVFQRLGRDRVESLGVDFDTARQRIGLFVPQLLVHIYGADRVYTDRRANDDSNNLPNNDPETRWLTTYTRHLVK